jgi:hypothetical protein
VNLISSRLLIVFTLVLSQFGCVSGDQKKIAERPNIVLIMADDNFYLTDAISNSAIKFIQDLRDESAPFFLYVSYNAPHWPLHALPEDIEKYIERYKVGWEHIRENRYQKMIEMGIV